jgi:hypothetical protein
MIDVTEDLRYRAREKGHAGHVLRARAASGDTSYEPVHGVCHAMRAFMEERGLRHGGARREV